MIKNVQFEKNLHDFKSFKFTTIAIWENIAK